MTTVAAATGKTVAAAIRAALLQADPIAKAMATRAVMREWQGGRLSFAFDCPMPDRPARPDRPELLPPNRMPRRGKGGSERGRIALWHALAHIEYVAIDLALDMAGRFGAEMGAGFTGDFLSVAADEAAHFMMLARKLRSLGAAYGDLPAHDGLWESAHGTRHDVAARLAVVPMVLEARGLDVTPMMIERVRGAGDARVCVCSNESLTTKFAMCESAQIISPRWRAFAKQSRATCGKASFHGTFAAQLSSRSTTRRAIKPVCRVRCLVRLQSLRCPSSDSGKTRRGVPTVSKSKKNCG